MDLTPNESIFEHFREEVTSVEVLGEFAHRRGNYRISFENGEVSDWNIQFDQDNGVVLSAECFNRVI